MPKPPPSFAPRREGYNQRILQPLNCLVFVLPFLVFFHLGAAYFGSSLLAPRDLGRILRYFGGTARYLPPLLIVVVLLLQHGLHGHRWKVHPRVVGGMLVESLLFTAPLVAVFYLSSMVLAANLLPQEKLFQELIMAAGAGVYEEFIFRLTFISLIALVFIDIFELPKDAVIVGAVIVSAVLFSLYHFSLGPVAGNERFAIGPFLFRATAGVYLGTLYVLRGFGVAVGAHAIYNMYVLAFSGQ